MLLALLIAPSLALTLPPSTSRRALLQAAASTSALATLPHAASAKLYNRGTPEPAKCYDAKFNEVPCGGAVPESADTGVSTASRSGGKAIDPNNFVASDYSFFPGLYPTIGGKLFKRAQNYAFTSKQQLYDALDTDAERAVLKTFDADIVIRNQDLQALAGKISTK